MAIDQTNTQTSTFIDPSVIQHYRLMCQCVNVCISTSFLSMCIYKCVQYVCAGKHYTCLFSLSLALSDKSPLKNSYLPCTNVLQHTCLSIKSLFCSVIYSFFHLFNHPHIHLFTFICPFIRLFTLIMSFYKFSRVFSNHCFMCQSVFRQCSKYHQPLSVAHLS